MSSMSSLRAELDIVWAISTAVCWLISRRPLRRKLRVCLQTPLGQVESAAACRIMEETQQQHSIRVAWALVRQAGNLSGLIDHCW